MLHVIEYFANSLKVTENGTILKLGYGFLFVFYSIYDLTLYHFRDKAPLIRLRRMELYKCVLID